MPLAPPVMTATLSVRRIASASVGSDDRLDAAAGRRVSKRVLDLREREFRGDERLDAELRHEGERAAKRAAATEGAVDADLAVMHVPEVEREPAALRIDAHELQHAGRPHQRQRLADELGLP